MTRRPVRRPRTPRVSPEAVAEGAVHASAPDRPALRPTPRSDDPRARAAARAAQLREHGLDSGEAIDKFYVPQGDIPEGWDYEWKRKTVLGKEDPAYEVAVARAGWEPVPVERHPSYMPKGWAGPIERDGLVLVERPKEISDEARRRDQKTARDQIRQKEEQLNGAPAGQFERAKSTGESLVSVKKSYGPSPIPE